ncbi:MAG TPA: MerR family transcriptional regulator [Bradyrhizobium sp.]|nr:MerR family transcriptional regulator [Bradyrhizobium sp.]
MGTLSKRSGVNIETIRYYERVKLLSPPPRTASGRRVYDSTDLRILVFIRRPRELGFSLVEIRELLRLGEPEKASCREVREIAVAWAGEAIFAATTASPSESKPIGQTSGHNNAILEPRRLPHRQRAIKSP